MLPARCWGPGAGRAWPSLARSGSCRLGVHESSWGPGTCCLLSIPARAGSLFSSLLDLVMKVVNFTASGERKETRRVGSAPPFPLATVGPVGSGECRRSES